MKNLLLLLLLLVPLTSLSQSKKELKKERKELEKLELKITNRGLNLKDVFVPYSDGWYGYQYKISENTITNNWSDALFEAGLNVGTYHAKKTVKDTENREMELSGERVFNGRYIFEILQGQILIRDLNEDNKLIASIRYKETVLFSVSVNTKNAYSRRLLILKELLKSNKYAR
jgi:hypothetical protein